MRFWPRFGFADEQKTKESEYDRPELWRRRLINYSLEIVPIMLFEMLIVGRAFPAFMGAIVLILGIFTPYRTPYKELLWLAVLWTVIPLACIAVDAWWPIGWYLRVINGRIVMAIIRPLVLVKWDWSATFPLVIETPMALVRMSNFWFVVRCVVAIAPLAWLYPTMLGMMRGLREIAQPKAPEIQFQPARVRKLSPWTISPEIVDEGTDVEEEAEEDPAPIYRIGTVIPNQTGNGYHKRIEDFDMSVLKTKGEPALAATRRLAALVSGFIETEGKERAPWSKNYWTGKRHDGRAVFSPYLWEGFAKYMLEKGWAEKLSPTETDITEDGLGILLKLWEQERQYLTEELEEGIDLL